MVRVKGADGRVWGHPGGGWRRMAGNMKALDLRDTMGGVQKRHEGAKRERGCRADVLCMLTPL